jgi:hypothetical protein
MMMLMLMQCKCLTCKDNTRSVTTSTSLLDETLGFALYVANDGDEGDASRGSGLYL